MMDAGAGKSAASPDPADSWTAFAAHTPSLWREGDYAEVQRAALSLRTKGVGGKARMSAELELAFAFLGQRDWWNAEGVASGLATMQGIPALF